MENHKKLQKKRGDNSKVSQIKKKTVLGLLKKTPRKLRGRIENNEFRVSCKKYVQFSGNYFE